MKTISKSVWALAFVAGLLLVACNTSQKRIGYNTIYSVQRTGTAAVDGYYSLVIKGALPTNDVPKVSRAYNQFQASVLVALDVVQFNTNALAPASLVIEATDLVNLVNSIKGKN